MWIRIDHAICKKSRGPDDRFCANTVFDGVGLHRDATVVIVGDTIRDVTPAIGVPCDIWTTLLPEEAWVVPGFIDLQVNGAQTRSVLPGSRRP